MPEFQEGLESLNFPGQFEKYYIDNFELRNILLSIDVNIRYRVFHESIYNDVIVGENNFQLFNLPNIINDCQKIITIPPEKLSTFIKRLEYSTSWLEKNGVQFYITVAPNKCTIYPENFRNTLPSIGTQSNYDLFLDMAESQSNGKLNIIDLTQPLQLSKSPTLQVFHSTDTHWNDDGIYIAYRQIMNELHKDGIKSDLISKEDLKTLHYHQALSQAMYFPNINDFVSDTVWYVYDGGAKIIYDTNGVTIFENPEANNDLTLVVYHDSFFYMRANVVDDEYLDANNRDKLMRTLLAEHFNKTIFLSRNYDQNWSNQRDYLQQVLDTFDPDIILVEVVERNLSFLGKRNEQNLIVNDIP